MPHAHLQYCQQPHPTLTPLQEPGSPGSEHWLCKRERYGQAVIPTTKSHLTSCKARVCSRGNSSVRSSTYRMTHVIRQHPNMCSMCAPMQKLCHWCTDVYGRAHASRAVVLMSTGCQQICTTSTHLPFTVVSVLPYRIRSRLGSWVG